MLCSSLPDRCLEPLVENLGVASNRSGDDTMVFWFAMQSLVGRSTVQCFTPDWREILHPEPKKRFGRF
jgi:hypothetical protein